MALKDFLDYVVNNPNAEIEWNVGGRAGKYIGTLVIVDKVSTNPSIGKYRDLEIQTKTGRNPIVGSAEVESPFSRIHTIKNNRITRLEAA